MERAGGAAVGQVRQALYRGLDQGQVCAAEEGKGLAAEQITVGGAQHASDVAEGSRRRTAGLSFSKCPFIACAYAAKSQGRPLCGDERRIREELGSMDCSGAEGEEAMRAAGATKEAVSYAQHDGEYSMDGAVGNEFLYHDETGRPR